MSIILAIETSTEVASVALLINGLVISREISGTQNHSQTVLPMVKQLLDESGLAISQCDVFAFGSGPGSFTGVRTACGIVQGLAFGADRPVIPVITLDAMAYGFKQETGISDVVTVLDARMGEVYWAQYHYAQDLTALIAPMLSSPEMIEPIKKAHGCGNGIEVYRDRIKTVGLEMRPGAENLMPHAKQIVKLAEQRLQAGQVVSAQDAQPFYLRNKVALTTVERAAQLTA